MKFKNLKIKAETDEYIDICIYGDIIALENDRANYEDVTPMIIREFLDYAQGRPLNIYINSVGGDVSAGLSIYNMLKAYKNTVNVYIDGLAGSIASIIAMAGDNIYMPNNATLMIHRTWGNFTGNTLELNNIIEFLMEKDEQFADIYLSKVKDKTITKDDILDMMTKETWLNSQEAEKIFDIIVIEATKIYAMIKENDIKNYKNIPKELKNKIIENNKNKRNLEIEREKLNLLLMI